MSSYPNIHFIGKSGLRTALIRSKSCIITLPEALQSYFGFGPGPFISSALVS